MKALKRRVTSVKNIQQIMKAMNLVAASKVQRYRNRMESVRPFFDEAKHFFNGGVIYDSLSESEYFSAKPAKSTAYVVVGGERGLCGSYNTNIFKEALVTMENDKNVKQQMFTIGEKSREYFIRRGKTVTANYAKVVENVHYGVADDIARHLIELYQKGEIDSITLSYTKFETLLSHKTQSIKLLPLVPMPPAPEAPREIIYEPTLDTYLIKSVPIHLAMYIFGAMVEAAVCEQASRMTSMDSANRNAGEIVDKLTLMYNRIRQGAITQEISEIVGGANAV